MPIVEKRLTSVEEAIDLLLQLNTQFAGSLADQQRRTIAMERRADAMEKRADAVEEWAASMVKRADVMEKRLESVEQSLESVRRFDRQTRRLWVMIARKVDWLDEEDIDSWEAEED